MATPAFLFLSENLGRKNLYLLALKPSIEALAKESGCFQEVFCWDPDKQGLAMGLQTLHKIRAEKFAYSLALFPSSHWKFSLFAFMAGIRQRWGFGYAHTQWPRYLQQVSLKLDVDAHDTLQNMHLAETFLGTKNLTPAKLFFPLKPSPISLSSAASEIYFVCHPGSSAERGMDEKRLPAEQYGQLILKLHSELGFKCLLIGGLEEENLRAEVKKIAASALVEWPSKNLSELAWLIQNSQFFLGNDSGLMHMAVALDKRCVVFFGPTDEKRTGPFEYWVTQNGLPKHLIIRREDLQCAPCWTIRTIGKNPPCIHNDTRCLQNFPLQAYWPRLKLFLQNLNKT